MVNTSLNNSRQSLYTVCKEHFGPHCPRTKEKYFHSKKQESLKVISKWVTQLIPSRNKEPPLLHFSARHHFMRRRGGACRKRAELLFCLNFEGGRLTNALSRFDPGRP